MDLNIEQFTEEQIDAQIKLIEEKLEGRLLDSYKPYPKQELFHRLGGDAAISDRLLMAGNQCNYVGSSIDLPQGRSRRFDEMLGEPGFDVQSWDGVSRSTSRASSVFLRGIEPTYRLVLSNGQSMYCSARHQILTVDGWRSLRDYARLVGGWRCQETVEDSPANYATGSHPGDALARADRDSDREPFPLRGDAREHRRLSWHGDATEPILTHTQSHLVSFRLPTSVDDPSQLAALFSQFPDAVSLSDAQWPTQRVRDVRRQLLAYGLPRGARSSSCRSIVSSFVHEEDRGFSGVEETLEHNAWLSQSFRRSVSWCAPGSINLEFVEDDPRTAIVMASTPPLIGGVEIIAIQPLGYYPIVDITVKRTHNYLNSGVISHNCGKTWSAAAETAYHLCGRYPSWWKGKRFSHAVRGWAGSPTSQTTRDAAQRLLLGPLGAMGTGLIPARYIVHGSVAKTPHGVPNSIDSVLVKHISGKNSYLQFKTYEQGREKWQGDTLDFVWFDEEPDEEIWSEGRTRTNVPGNFTYMTFTPLKGMSKIVTRFMREKPMGSVIISMTVDDALHYTPEQRAKVIAGYLTHERKARAMGIPVLGSGAVFPVEEEQLLCDAFQIPDHWPRICGMDMGWEHPTACAWIAWDRDTDTLYVYDTHRVKEQTPIVHAATMKAKGVWIPVAWPHDGLQHDKGSGAQLAKQYRELGVNMLKEKATHAPEKGKKEGSGGYGVEAGVSAMLQRMQTGRFKVFRHLSDWFEEFRTYYRQDGLIVKEHDDLMSATRMGVMMLRFAKTKRAEAVLSPKVPSYQPSYSSTGVLG